MLRNFRKTRRPRRLPSKVRVAEIQPLEQRTLPAGTVTASFASNVLTVTGDGKDNNVIVSVVATDTAIQIQVAGIEGTSVKVGSTINEPDTVIPFNPTNAFGIVVNMAGGHDAIEINVDPGLGTRTLTKLDVNTGDEVDRIEVFLGEGTTLNFTDAVSFKTGEDFDIINVELFGSVTIAKTLTVDSGLDPDEVNVSVQADSTLTVTGATTFNLSDGDDFLQISGDGIVAFSNALTINAGEDTDEVLLGLTKGFTVKGAATFNMLDGDDTVSILHNASTVDFQSGASVNLGSGHDHFFVNAQEEAGVGEGEFTPDFGSGTLRAAGSAGLTISGGSGDDHIEFQERLTLIGGLNVNLGDGNDEFTIVTDIGTIVEGIAANSIGKLTIDTGDDADSVHMTVNEGTSLAVSGAAVINTGKGFDEVEMINFDTVTTFGAGLTIDTGATNSTQSGVDHLVLEGGRFGITGALKVATGGGMDFVSIESSLSVSGETNFDTGTGNDNLIVFLEASPTLIADGAPHNTFGAITFNSGSGSDYVELYTASGGITQINGTANFTTGTGHDDVWVNANANLTITKDLKLDTGAGDDHVFVEAINGSLRVNGSESVNLGDDDDCFIQGQSAALDEFRDVESDFFGESDPEATLQIDTNVSIVGGSGDDFIGLDLIQIGKDKPTETSAFPASVTTIDSGAGFDIVAADKVVLRDLKVLAGADDDIVYARDVTVRGTTNIDLGAGDDEFAVTGNTTLGDNVTLLGGTGDDDFSIDEGVTLAASKKIKLDGGAGEGDFLANVSTDIGEADLNPNPPTGIETLDGEFGIAGLIEIIEDYFAGCILNFEEDFLPV